MKNFALPSLLMLACLAAPMARAADPVACPALADKEAYGKKYDDLTYLIPGKNGWFFRSKSDLYDNYPVKNPALPQEKQFADALRARGTELVIVYIPTRGMGAKAFVPMDNPLTKGYDPAAASQHYGAFIDRLQKAGVNIVGIPDPAVKEAFFYKADQHWTTAGAREMAEVLAARLKTFPAFNTIVKKTFKTEDQPKRAVVDGSFNKALAAICQTEPAKESDQLTVTTSASDTEDADGLFGAAPAPEIVLAGTSNSKKETNNLNFDGLLKEQLSADVFNTAISGGGLGDSITAYLASDQFQQHPPKFLIWEIPGYYDLTGRRTRSLLQEITPAALGQCAQENVLGVTSGTYGDDMDKLSVSLIPTLKTTAASTYLVLKFDTKVKGRVSVNFAFQDDKKPETIALKRSKRYPADGTYYIMPRTNAPLDKITISYSDKIKGATLQATLCTVPEKFAQAKTEDKKDVSLPKEKNKAPGLLDRLKNLFNDGNR